MVAPVPPATPAARRKCPWLLPARPAPAMYSGASAAPGASGCTRHSPPHQLWAACPAALAGGIHSKVFSVQEAEASRTGCSVSGDLCIDCPWYHPLRDEVESSAGVEPAPSRRAAGAHPHAPAAHIGGLFFPGTPSASGIGPHYKTRREGDSNPTMPPGGCLISPCGRV